MLIRRINILIPAFFILLILKYYDLNIAFASENLMSFDKLNKGKVTTHDQTHLRSERVKFSKAVRNLMNLLCQQENCEDLIASLRLKVSNEIMVSDSSLGKQILNKLDNDSSFIKHCLYLADLKNHWKSIQSKHFIFYFNDDNDPDNLAMQEWDKNFERLSKTFRTQISEKIPFKIDKSEKYGRCFAPWVVQWGIKQGRVGDNPHELVHIMLFKYSDVPFFHEPLAFIYGAYKGDFNVVSEQFSKYEKIIADSGYVSATKILHFPQLVGLQKSKWASSFYFIYKLVEKYDIEMLLTLMRKTPWESSVDDFLNNFREVYGIELQDFEQNILKEIKH